MAQYTQEQVAQALQAGLISQTDAEQLLTALGPQGQEQNMMSPEMMGGGMPQPGMPPEMEGGPEQMMEGGMEEQGGQMDMEAQKQQLIQMLMDPATPPDVKQKIMQILQQMGGQQVDPSMGQMGAPPGMEMPPQGSMPPEMGAPPPGMGMPGMGAPSPYEDPYGGM